MPDLFTRFADDVCRDGLSVAPHRLYEVACDLSAIIKRGGPVSRRLLSRMMTERFGHDDSSGLWSMREAYDALEAAQVVVVRDHGDQLIGSDDRARSFERLMRIAESLPTQSYRSERQIAFQQFSTPLPLAFLAAEAAAIRAQDLVLEPSAGTGMLAVFARMAGAELVLNERDRLRAELLTLLFGTEVARHDAEHIDDRLPRERSPTLVLINPPFARSEGRGRDVHAGARPPPLGAREGRPRGPLRRDHVAVLCGRWHWRPGLSLGRGAGSAALRDDDPR